MVKFTQATCPSCGGQLQIPDNLTKAFCSYCGATVILEWEGRPGPGPTIESYMKLGKALMGTFNKFEEAYEYFSKALELNPDHREAWLWKGAAAGGCYEVSVHTGLLKEHKFQEALECLRQSGLTHDEMVVLLVDGLKTDSSESNRRVVGSTAGPCRKYVVDGCTGGLIPVPDEWVGLSYDVCSTGLLGLSSWAPLDLALLYLDVAERIEPSAIELRAYSESIWKAIRERRFDLVQEFKQKIAETAPTSEPFERNVALSDLILVVGTSRLSWSSTSAKDLHEAAGLLELVLQIAPDTAYYDHVAGSKSWVGGMEPGGPGGYVLLALRAVEHGLPELAGQFLEKALELADRSDIAHAICGAANYTTKTKPAADLLELALKIDPHDEFTANAVAGIRWLPPYPAEESFDGADFGGYLRLAERAAANGSLDLAERYLERALEIGQAKIVKKCVNFVKEKHGLRRPRTGWFW